MNNNVIFGGVVSVAVVVEVGVVDAVKVTVGELVFVTVEAGWLVLVGWLGIAVLWVPQAISTRIRIGINKRLANTLSLFNKCNLNFLPDPFVCL